ncbi:MAG: hypothetical protein ACO24S_06945 [Ilumatobacteraceae bacterium]
MPVIMWDKYGDKWILERDAKLAAFRAMRNAVQIARDVDKRAAETRALDLIPAADIISAHADAIRTAIRRGMSA